MAANGKPQAEFRALAQGYELRSEDDGMPTLVGQLAVFDESTEINSRSEGHFIETISPGAFDKTISENRDKMRVLFEHGTDPQIGNKPLGPIELLQADERGVSYEVPLLDAPYVRELIPGLEAGLYGSSFRFEVLRQNWNRKAEKSEHNPQGLPERTVKEVRMAEFGPVTFPAYAGATSGLRSQTDRMQMLEEARADIPAISTLVDIYQFGLWFIEQEDDPDDEPDIAKMRQILALVSELIQTEAAENEGAENESAEELVSADQGAADAKRTPEEKGVDAPPRDRAGTSHPIRGRRAEVAAPLYAGKKEVEPRWRL